MHTASKHTTQTQIYLHTNIFTQAYRYTDTMHTHKPEALYSTHMNTQMPSYIYTRINTYTILLVSASALRL